MRYIVQTAIEVSSVNPDDGHSKLELANKVTIPCQSVTEANEIADGFNSIPGRQAWAGIEHYTEGGVKLVLSFADVHDIARAAKEIPATPISRDRLAAY